MLWLVPFGSSRDSVGPTLSMCTRVALVATPLDMCYFSTICPAGCIREWVNVCVILFFQSCPSLLHACRNGVAPVVSLDTKKFKLVQQLDAAMTSGTPSLVGCDRLTVEGDVRLAGATVFKVRRLHLVAAGRFLFFVLGRRRIRGL